MVTTLPHRFRGASLEHFDTELARPACELVESVAGVPRDTPVTRHVVGVGWQDTGTAERNLAGIPGLVIVGNVGAGKTHMLAGIANALRDVVPWSFRSALAIVDEAKAAIGGDAPPIDYAVYRGLLLLDDLSGVRPTDFALDILARIVRVRYDNALCTVVTTHAAHGALAELYGVAIASRLLEFGPVVKLAGADRRAPAGVRSDAGLHNVEVTP